MDNINFIGDEYPLATIFDVKGLVIENRDFVSEKIPEGTYLYSIMHDEHGEPSSIRPGNILVNWYGFFLTREPIPIKGERLFTFESEYVPVSTEEVEDFFRDDPEIMTDLQSNDDGDSEYSFKDGRWYRVYRYADEFNFEDEEITVKEFLSR